MFNSSVNFLAIIQYYLNLIRFKLKFHYWHTPKINILSRNHIVFIFCGVLVSIWIIGFSDDTFYFSFPVKIVSRFHL